MKDKMILRPRGTQDILHPRSFLYHKIEMVVTKILLSNNYQKVIFPTYEEKKLFSFLGDLSDVVTKEMFSFSDKKNRQLVLRPEGTASVARLVTQNKLIENSTRLKVFYWANMFRYERAQKGRYREFWQLGVELLNFEGVETDLEVILLANSILKKLGLSEFHFSINYLGDSQTREDYKKVLSAFLADKNSSLCADCQVRLQRNSLRILDCQKCSSLWAFPNFQDSLSFGQKKYFNKLKDLLSTFDISYMVDHSLVRGLDYYTGTVFEVSGSHSQKSIIGGGRYDQLLSSFSHQNTKTIPSIGFAIGIDRLVDFFERQLKEFFKIESQQVDILLISFDSNFFPECFVLREEIFKSDLSLTIEINLGSRKFSKSLQMIEKINPKLVIIIGKNEISESFLSIKETSSQVIHRVSRSSLVEWLQEKLG